MVASRTKLRMIAADLFQEAVQAAKPERFIKNAMRVDDNEYLCFKTGDDGNEFSMPFDFNSYYFYHVVALGKAAVGMTNEVNSFRHEKGFESFLIITHEMSLEEQGFLSRNVETDDFHIIKSSHPFPDEESLEAGKALMHMFKSMTDDDIIILLLSGGASSLAVAPADGITLDDKIDVTQLLFKAGADIKELNCVRKHLSKIKGGQLAQMTKAFRIFTIVLSDVYDDDASSIGSGLVTPDKTTFQDACDIMDKYQLWNQLPASVRKRLRDGSDGKIEETSKDWGSVTYYIAASNKSSVEAARNKAKDIVTALSHPFIGDASDGAKSLVQQMKKGKLHIEITGGETTVKITGDGVGGRNQHMALAFALQAEKEKLHEQYPKWAFLSGGTDGRDGPTEAAGGMVDYESLQRMRKAGIDPQKELDNCNSNHALKASHDLLPRECTGTNVGDIQIFIGDPDG